MSENTIDEEEIKKFENIADKWWENEGDFKPLHSLTPLRIKYIKQQINKNLNDKYKILDVGCGGGLVSIPLANMGYDITAIDASRINISVAKKQSMNSNNHPNFITSTIEEHYKSLKIKYDAILALEILEHISNIELFIKTCSQSLNKNGILIISTINKTCLSYLKAILGAEYILGLVPVGTHDWSKFLEPNDIINCGKKFNLNPYELRGLSYNPINNRWSFVDNTEVNYFLCLQKTSS